MRQALAKAIAILMITCGLTTPGNAQTKLDGYHTYAAHQVWQGELVKRFGALNPGVNIAYRAPAPTYDDGLLAIIRQTITGQQPDFYLGGMQLLREFVSRKLVQPFDDLLEGRDLKALGYSPEILAQGQVGGRQYALPWGVSTPVVFINANLVNQVGGSSANVTSWDQLIELAGKISKLGGDTIGMHWELGTDDWMTQNLLLNASAPLLTPDEQDIGFDNEKGLSALRLYHRFHKEGGQRPIEQQAARQAFLAGKMGFYMTSTAAVRSFETEIGKRFEFRTSTLPLLAPDATLSSAGMVAMIVTKDPTKRKAALDFVLFGTSAESQAFIVQNTGYMPSNTGSLSANLLGDFYRDRPNFSTSVAQIPRSRAWLGWPGENAVRISKLIRDEMTALANDQKSPEQTLADMSRGVRALLPKPK